MPELLSNIKKEIGVVGDIKRNVKFNAEIELRVSLYFDDFMDQIAPMALPVAMRTRLPVWLFSLTDFYGGFSRIRNVMPFDANWGEPGMCVVQNFVRPAGFVTPPYLPFEEGDLIINGGSIPGGFMYWIVIHCNNVAYSTFLNSFVSDLITINSIRYIVPAANANQFINPIFFGYQNLFGQTVTDTLDPRLFVTPRDPRAEVADMPIELPVDKKFMMGFQMNFNCPYVDMILFVSQIEPLTHK